ncbi:hypothetical protein BP422_13165 [Brevibacillus formosus]|uniref:Uncharacterized protein n=1 Tax=Brevibacillus formosus TaxID=54913 RepID=A0A220MHH1_9BACL|nr:hypothetical protein [Brevibacillus formosus]ASJ54423.1 hypothetical protein BP422_13165 [Brevibacillus formosus]
MFKTMLRKVLCAGAVISVLTFGSQAAFANDIVQNQGKQFKAEGQTQTKQNQNVKEKIQAQYQLMWFNMFGLKNTDGTQTTFNFARFTIGSTQTVTLQGAQFGESPQYGPPVVEYRLLKINGSSPAYMDVRGDGSFSRSFTLEPGTYFAAVTNFTQNPVKIYASVNVN